MGVAEAVVGRVRADLVAAEKCESCRPADKDKDKEKKVLENTTSGGVTLNDVIWHIGQEELPFGGVGPSGTGSYHGHDGFKEFSHAKAVYKQFSADLMAQMMPPYKGKMFESMKNQILKK